MSIKSFRHRDSLADGFRGDIKFRDCEYGLVGHRTGSLPCSPAWARAVQGFICIVREND
jgi:hypothetical protein